MVPPLGPPPRAPPPRGGRPGAGGPRRRATSPAARRTCWRSAARSTCRCCARTSSPSPTRSGSRAPGAPTRCCSSSPRSTPRRCGRCWTRPPPPAWTRSWRSTPWPRRPPPSRPAPRWSGSTPATWPPWRSTPAASPPSATPCPAGRCWSPRAASATGPTSRPPAPPAPTPSWSARRWSPPMIRPPRRPGCWRHQPELEEPMPEPRKILLGEDQLPSTWFNIVPSMPTKPGPYLHPQTREPVGPEALAPLFPMALIGQEVATDEWIDIPGPVMDTYRLWRPTPLIRALDLERALGTPARIYYKYEGGSPAGSHKPNTAVAQAWYNKAEGVRRLTTETGAGQWGSALAFACARFGLECKVYMVRASYDGKPYRRSIMETWGASVTASPSPETNAGRAVLAGDPDSPGSLGIAISEAVEDAAQRDDTHYSLGSVLNHVLLHQTG